MKMQANSQKHFPTRPNPFLRWSRIVLLFIGILALSYCSFVLLDSKIYQAYQSRQFEKARSNLKPVTKGSDDIRPLPLLPPAEQANRARTASLSTTGRGRTSLGRIEMSRIGLSAMILEGTDEWALRRAVGHIPETALPGETGNVALAGHRDTFFRSLRLIRTDDVITVKTLNGDFQYRVETIAVVPPTDVQVLNASGGRTLTLITCFPFEFVGAAPNRFVVRAREFGTLAQLTESQGAPRF